MVALQPFNVVTVPTGRGATNLVEFDQKGRQSIGQVRKYLQYLSNLISVVIFKKAKNTLKVIKRALLDAEVVYLVATAAPAGLVRLEGQVLTKVLPIAEIQIWAKTLLIKLLSKYNLPS